MFKYIVLLALVPAIFATEGVTPCRDGTFFPSSVDVAGCATAPCRVSRGTDAQMYVGFNAPRDGDEFYPSVQAGVGSLWVNYPLSGPITKACDFMSESRCPLDEGEYAIYDFRFPVEDNYPRIAVQVEMTLNDAAGKFMCVSVPLIVVD